MTFRGTVTLGVGLAFLFILYVFAKVDGGFLSWFLFYTFIALFLYEFASKLFTMRKIDISRAVSANHLSASQSLEVEITLSRSSFWPLFWVKVSDELPDKLSIRASGAVQTMIPLWNRNMVCRYRLTELPRGIHHLNSVRVESGDMLGLQKFSKTCTLHQQVVVYPRVVPVRGWRSAYVQDSGGRQSVSRRAEESSNVIGIRQYVPGDKPSRIHWSASARTGVLQSKEFELHVSGDYIIMPDASLSTFSKDNLDRLFDLEMTISASLMKHALDTKHRFGAAIHSNRLVRYETGRDQALFLRCMENFAELQPVCLTPFAKSFERMAREFPSGCILVVVSPLLSREMAYAISSARKRSFVEWFVPVARERLTPEEVRLGQNLQADRVNIHFIEKAEQLSALRRGGTAFAT